MAARQDQTDEPRRLFFAHPDEECIVLTVPKSTKDRLADRSTSAPLIKRLTRKSSHAVDNNLV